MVRPRPLRRGRGRHGGRGAGGGRVGPGGGGSGDGGVGVLRSGLFFYFISLVLVRLFLCLASMGGRRSGSHDITLMSLGAGSGSLCVFKGGKMGALSVRAAASRCHSPSSCMQWDRKYKTYTHCQTKTLASPKLSIIWWAR